MEHPLTQMDSYMKPTGNHQEWSGIAWNIQPMCSKPGGPFCLTCPFHNLSQRDPNQKKCSSSVWHLWFGIFSLGCLAQDLELMIFSLGSLAQDHQLKKLAQDLQLRIFRFQLANCRLQQFSFQFAHFVGFHLSGFAYQNSFLEIQLSNVSFKCMMSYFSFSNFTCQLSYFRFHILVCVFAFSHFNLIFQIPNFGFQDSFVISE